jgi:predicted porin
LAAFRSSDQTAIFVAMNHYFTPKLSTTLSFNYVIAQYQNLNPLFVSAFRKLSQKTGVEEDSWRVVLTAEYNFNLWSSAFITYTYEDLTSGFDNAVTLRSFNRSTVNAGFGLAY